MGAARPVRLSARRAALAAIAAALAVAAPTAPARAASPQQCTARWDLLVKQHQTDARSYQSFMAGCLAGSAAGLPPAMDTPQTAPAGATARCQDGTYTTAMSPLAACEHHRGLGAMLR